MSPDATTAAVTLGLASPALAARVQDLTAQSLRAWALRWGVEPSAIAVEAAAAEAGVVLAAPAGSAWLAEADAAPARSAHLAWPSDLEGRLLEALYGGDASAAPDSLGARSATHVAADLRRLLAQVWQVGRWTDPAPGAGRDAPAADRWQAPVDLRIVLAGTTLVARLPALRLRPSPARGAATPLRQAELLAAFAALPVAARAVVGEAEVGLADLAQLQCGDVLLLDTPLHEPTRLGIEGCTAALRGGLGRLGERRAVQLAGQS